MSKREIELEEQRSKFSDFRLLYNIVRKQEIYLNVVTYEQAYKNNLGKSIFSSYPLLTHDKTILTVLQEHENQIISIVNKDDLNMEKADKINKKLDDLLTEKFYRYINGEICSRSPSNPEEVKSRIKKCISEVRPINLCVSWGGDKENDEHVADDFDIMAIERLLNIVPGNLYHLDIKILFCDSHATQINKVPEKFVKKYKESLEQILNSYMYKDEHSHFYYAHNFKSVRFVDEPHRIKLHSLSKILESCQIAYKFSAEHKSKNEEKEISYVPIASKLPELEKEGEILAEEVIKDPAKAELLKKRTSTHYRPPIAKQILEKFKSLLGNEEPVETRVPKKYVSTRYVDSKLMNDWYEFEDAIFVSFGDKKLETIFSDLPTIFIKGSDKFDGCPWFLNAKKLSYVLMIGSEGTIETISQRKKYE
jgi:hypothetical protein